MMQTATVTPGPPQRLRALERANEVRLARADLKRRIADREISAAEVILDCPWEATSWAVCDLLMSQRRWGRTRCQKFLGRNQISEVKTVGELTDRRGDGAGPTAGPKDPGADRSELDPDRYRTRAGEQEEPHDECHDREAGAHNEHALQHEVAGIVKAA
jgi:hypothetical protein